jgi:hypothetical protein
MEPLADHRYWAKNRDGFAAHCAAEIRAILRARHAVSADEVKRKFMRL